MNTRASRSRMAGTFLRDLLAIVCAILLVPGDVSVLAFQASSPTPAAQDAVKLPEDQLDSLVSPIALYPDPLLSQTLVASTYPLEVIQLQQWMEKNKSLKGDALTQAVQKQDWDPSIQAMAAFPDVVKQLAENIKWTTDLGNAFLAQQDDVMNAVQRMRRKAKNAGNLKTTEQQKVETKTVENKTVVVIQPTSPEVVYVPSYNPVVVYGPPVYPYPPITYPPPGYYAAGMAISFGVGVAVGAAFSGGWGWGCGWGGHNNIYINNNNNFVNNYNNRQNINNRQNVNNPNRGNSNWQHNPQHRGGAPYSDRTTARQYGGTTRGDSLATRQASARQNQGQFGNRQQASVGDRGSGFGGRQPGGGDPSGRTRDAGGRGSGAGAGSFGGDRGGGGGGDRVGNRSVGSGGSSRGSSAFGGGGFSGGSARASSSRGSRSMGGGGFRSGGRRR